MRKIIKIKLIKNFVVEFRFDNDELFAIDFQKKINKGGVFQKLEDKTLFTQLKISSNGRYIYWDDDIELCADALWYEATGEQFSADEKEAS